MLEVDATSASMKYASVQVKVSSDHGCAVTEGTQTCVRQTEGVELGSINKDGRVLEDFFRAAHEELKRVVQCWTRIRRSLLQKIGYFRKYVGGREQAMEPLRKLNDQIGICLILSAYSLIAAQKSYVCPGNEQQEQYICVEESEIEHGS